jgi:rhodanese-related sulfurtransferase
MLAIYSIAPEKLSRLIGTPACPALVDVRTDEDFEADPHFIPGTVRRSHANVAEWAPSLSGQTVVVICKKGQKISEGVAAWLRHAGASPNVLDGGIPAPSRERLARARARRRG